MKYYSDVLHMLYDTQDALEKAEAEKRAKDDEKAHQKEIAEKLKAEDKKHFLELREKAQKAEAEYQSYSSKMTKTYSLNTVLDWLAEAVLEEEGKTVSEKKGIYDARKTAKTAREPESLGEILMRIFEDMH